MERVGAFRHPVLRGVSCNECGEVFWEGRCARVGGFRGRFVHCGGRWRRRDRLVMEAFHGRAYPSARFRVLHANLNSADFRPAHMEVRRRERR